MEIEMGMLEIWTAKGWECKLSFMDVKVGDVFRMTLDGVTGAALIALSSARHTDSTGGEMGISVKSKVLNQAQSSYCNECGGVFDASSHSDECPKCGGDLCIGTGFEKNRRLVMEPVSVNSNEARTFH
jgi:hypothetical protein